MGASPPPTTHALDSVARRSTIALVLLLVAIGCAAPPTRTLVPFEPDQEGTPVPTSIEASEAQFSAALEPVVPRGTAVVFRDGDGLWAIEGPASARPLLMGDVTDWRVSPDRAMVAVIVPGDEGVPGEEGATLIIVDWASGEELSRVTSTSLPGSERSSGPGPREIVAVEWRPDGRAVYVGTGFRGDTFATVADELLLVDPVSASLEPLAPQGEGGIPLPSPDGRLVALTRPGHSGSGEPTSIAVARADGSDLRTILEHPAIRTDSGVPDVRLPIWSGDSDALLLVLPGADDSGQPWTHADDSEIVRIPVDGSPPQRVTIPLRGHASGRGISWSPGARAMAYTRSAARGTAGPAPGDATRPAGERGSEDRHDLVIAAWDGSEEVVYATAPSLRFLDWAADSEHFLYDNEGTLYVGAVGSPPVSFGAPAFGPPRVAGVALPAHLVLLSQDLSVRTVGGDEALLAGDVGRFALLEP